MPDTPAAPEPTPSPEAEEAASLDAFIARVEADQAPPADAPTPEPAPEPVVTGGEEAPPADELTPRAKQLAAISRREAELRAREAELDTRFDSQVDTIRQEIIQMFRENPAQLAEDLGIEPAQLAEQYTGVALGEDAPLEHRVARMQAEFRRENAALKKQLEDRDREATDARARAADEMRASAVDRELASYVKTPPAELTFISRYATKNPAAAQKAIAQVMADAINANPDQEWPSVADAARALDEDMREDWEFYNTQASTTTATKPTSSEPATPAAPTLSNADVSTLPDRGLTEIDPDDDEYYNRRALAVAKKHGANT